jgi:hypothetical protein
VKDWHFKLQVPKVPWAICQLPKTSWTLPLLVCGPLDNTHQYHSYVKIFKVWLANLIWFENWQAIYWHKFKPWRQAVKKDDYSQKKKVTIFLHLLLSQHLGKTPSQEDHCYSPCYVHGMSLSIIQLTTQLDPENTDSAANMIHTSFLQKAQWPFKWIRFICNAV